MSGDQAARSGDQGVRQHGSDLQFGESGPRQREPGALRYAMSGLAWLGGPAPGLRAAALR
jgi:hypothetical protein